MPDNPFVSPVSNDASLGASLGTTMTLRYVHPLQAGKVLAILYFLLSLLFVPIIVLGSVMAPSPEAAGLGLGMGLFLIAMYTIGGFIGGVIAAAIYNVVAKMVGGMRFDFE